MRTGEMAKLANVSEKTIRYYDKLGLLKPSKVEANNYRYYTEYDLLKLQRILFLKSLGFSLEEIQTLVFKDEELIDSLNTQRQLLSQKIESLSIQKQVLDRMYHQALEGKVDWKSLEKLFVLNTMESEISSNYRNSSYLSARIALHEKYSQNPEPWFSWIASKIKFTGANRVLELGTGTGRLWDYFNPQIFRNREVFLTDKSPGMVEEVRSKFGKQFNCLEAECESIPFKDHNFELVIANHVLFYCSNLDRALSEITRVLTTQGRLYATTYGKDHMKEITELCQRFDSRIILSNDNLSVKFGKENGAQILKRHFDTIISVPYDDSLQITEQAPLFNYIMSCHGNQSEILSGRLNEFKKFLEAEIARTGSFYVKKEAVLYICKKPRPK